MKKKLVIILLLLVILYCIFMIYSELSQRLKEENEFANLRDLVSEEDNNPDDNSFDEDTVIMKKMEELYKKNDDFVGWVEIENTRISYPVMHTPSDEEYYIHRNFDKEYSFSGTPFLAANSDVDEENQQLIIYGHNMINDTLFSDLVKYKKKSFWEEHPTISFDTLNESKEYEIYAAFEIDVQSGTNHFMFYQENSFNNEDDFNNFINETKSLSVYNTNITPEYGETLLTLVTCSDYNETGRVAVFAVEKQ